ncbi:MAG: hypothetical protein Tsb0016_07450 [Sphingomonadales bacterium]
MLLAFRTDASRAIGTGHVSRCLALADLARQAGDQSLFICRAHDGHLIASIRDAGYPVRVLEVTGGDDGDLAHSAWLGASQAEDAAATIQALDGARPDWLVIDHYGLDARWQRALRPHAQRLLAIDDLADRQHDIDLLVDQNFFLAMAQRYDGLLPRSCLQLLGPRHALLRPAFAQARQALPPRQAGVKRLVIFFGGVDAGGHSALALQALARLRLGDDCDIDLVLGPLNAARAAVLAEAEAMALPRLRVHADGADMAALLAQADLAVGACGVSQWERACLGAPSIVLAVADNQRPIVADLAAAGYCWGVSHGEDVGAEDLAALIRTALLCDEARQAMAARGRCLVDGEGARRVLAAMRAAAMELRPVGEADGARLFQWRNDPATRRHALNPAPLDQAAHHAWLDAALADPQRLLWMGVLDRAAIGVLRFDLDGDAALVSIYLDPARHGQGLGRALLRAGLARLARTHPHIRLLEADVLDANGPSREIFEAVGFQLHQRRYRFSLNPEEPSS